MKVYPTLPLALVAIDGLSSTSARKTIPGHVGRRTSAARKRLVRNARRVQDNNYGYYYGGQGQQGGEDAKEAWHLAGYSLKMLSCLQGEQAYNYERGEVEPSTVIFRLCPADTCGADNSTSLPCEEGYGDFSVGINTFAKAYVESVKDNYNNGMTYYSYDYGEFNVEEYVNECRLYEPKGGQDANYYSNYASTYAYIGAACTSDGTDIRLASFSDPYCTTETSESFESTHYGMSLPYSEGGLIPDTCMSCMSMNDNYEWELSEMCHQPYEDATYRCERYMQNVNQYYGADTRGCEYLDEKVPTEYQMSKSKTEGSFEKKGNFFQNQPEGAKFAEEVIVLLVLSALAGAGAVYFFFRKTSEKKLARKIVAGEEPKEGASFIESIKSGTMLVKVAALAALAKIMPSQVSADNTEEEKMNSYVAPEEVSNQSLPQVHSA